jgi:DNA segregation ATPase FtsK/SpoIIIE-like protein
MSAVTMDDLSGPDALEELTQALADVDAAPDISTRRKVGRLTLLESAARVWRRATYRRRLTEAERTELAAKAEAEKARKALDAELLEKCHQCERMIASTLEGLEVAYFYKQHEKKEQAIAQKAKQISFLEPAYTSEVLMLRVDLSPRGRPQGVSSADLVDQRVLDDLSLTLGHKVTVTKENDEGLIYWVWLNRTASTIPSHVRYDEMIALRPASAGPLAIPVGMGAGAKPIWRDLADFPHMLIAGSTGGGKTNAIRQMLATLLAHNPPSQMMLAGVDLKRGVEFQGLEGMPHLVHYQGEDGNTHSGIAQRRDDVAPLLKWIGQEIDRRYDLFYEKGVNHIGKYNGKGGAMPFVVLIIDEWASLKIDRAISRAANDLLSDAANRARATGVHMVVCTQLPNRQNLDTAIITQLPARLLFAVPDPWVGQVLVGDSNAVTNIYHPGRAFWSFGRDRELVQVPMITDEKLEEVLAAAKAGVNYIARTSAKHDVSDTEVMEWAIRENDGNLGWREIYKRYRGRGLTQNDAQAMPRRLVGRVVLVGSTQYLVNPPATGHGKGKTGYRLLPVDAAQAIPAELSRAEPAGERL